MKTISNLTDLEKKVLQSVASLMYAEWGFSDVGATDVSEDINVSIKVVRGALGSLVKKGLLSIEDRSDHFGYKPNDPSWEPIIYLINDSQGLVESWVEESDGQLEPCVIE